MSKINMNLAQKPRSAAGFNRTGAIGALAAVLTFGFAAGPTAPAAAQEKPNIIFIMGDDIGWSNIGVYNQGILAGRTPNLDRLGTFVSALSMSAFCQKRQQNRPSGWPCLV